MMDVKRESPKTPRRGTRLPAKGSFLFRQDMQQQSKTNARTCVSVLCELSEGDTHMGKFKKYLKTLNLEDFNAKSSSGYTLFFILAAQCAKPRVSTVTMPLVAQQALKKKYAFSKIENGRSILHLLVLYPCADGGSSIQRFIQAVSKESHDYAKVLESLGISINFATENSRTTPLQCAINNRNIGDAIFLFNLGADIFCENGKGRNAIDELMLLRGAVLDEIVITSQTIADLNKQKADCYKQQATLGKPEGMKELNDKIAKLKADEKKSQELLKKINGLASYFNSRIEDRPTPSTPNLTA